MLPPVRVLAAVDFAESSRAALECAGRVAGHVDAELHVLHVAAMPTGAVTCARGIDFTGDLYEDLRTFSRTVPPAALRHPRYHVVVGDPARVIRDVAHRESCDLIVVGTHGQSGDFVQPFGPTTEELLRESDIPVLVIPYRWRPPSPNSKDLTGLGPIVAGLDFTCPSIDAATAAARIAARLRTRLVVIHVLAPQTPVCQRDEEAVAHEPCDEARQRLQPLVAALGEIATVDVHVERGSVATTLAHAAEAESGGLVVLGRAVNARSSGPPGAVASRVLMHAHVPVLVHSPSS